MRAEKRVKVSRELGTGRWIVRCELCAGDDSFFALFLPGAVKGWTMRWVHAVEYAHRHAAAHEARRCAQCDHLPTGPLPGEAGS